jgi:hypothetical protein
MWVPGDTKDLSRKSTSAVGFRLRTCPQNEVATQEEARFFGMNAQEELILVEKV